MTQTAFDPDAMRQRIRDTLAKKRRTQADVARKAGLGHGYLTNILARGHMPTVEKLDALCRELGVPIGWVMYGVEVPTDFDEVIEIMKRDPERFNAVLALLK